jgi:hypothetical protein
MSGEFRTGHHKYARHFYPDGVGRQGPTGPTGPGGPTGPTGPQGAGGGSLVVDYASFFSLAGSIAPVANDAPFPFTLSGPAGGAAITRSSASTFTLNTTGTYEVTWQTSVTEPGQTQLALNGAGLPDTTVGRATGTSQIYGSTLISATSGDTLSVLNKSGGALTLTPPDGSSTHAISATLTIKLLSP